MDLYKDLLIALLRDETVTVSFPDLPVAALLESSCYRALDAIRAILAEPMLDDVTCYRRIEFIIGVLEEEGVFNGLRHDEG